jgi:DNA-binding transcriptional MerR regulator
VQKAWIKMEDLSQISFDFSEPLSEVKKQTKTASAKPDLIKTTTKTDEQLKSIRGRKSLKSFDAEADLIVIPEDEILFKKSYYSIGDVAAMFRLKPSLIRFWENEFDILKPKKNAKGDRHFRPEDVKNLKLIYHLLRERKYTIEGAKEFLKHNKEASKKFEMISSLKRLKAFLLELKTSL